MNLPHLRALSSGEEIASPPPIEKRNKKQGRTCYHRLKKKGETLHEAAPLTLAGRKNAPWAIICFQGNKNREKHRSNEVGSGENKHIYGKRGTRRAFSHDSVLRVSRSQKKARSSHALERETSPGPGHHVAPNWPVWSPRWGARTRQSMPARHKEMRHPPGERRNYSLRREAAKNGKEDLGFPERLEARRSSGLSVRRLSSSGDFHGSLNFPPQTLSEVLLRRAG